MNGSDVPGQDAPDPLVVPLFPLPNVVLFPRAVLPLHIFEERYKQMTADTLAGDRLVAMALLKRGWENNYYAKPAIEPVVCVGRILSHERLPNGEYNFLLQGQLRARIVREIGAEPYRQAEVVPLPQARIMEIDLDPQRQRLIELFTESPLGVLSGAKQFRQILAGALPTTEVADLIAFSYLEDAPLKQALLAEANVRQRVEKVVEALESLRTTVTLTLRASQDSTLN